MDITLGQLLGGHYPGIDAAAFSPDGLRFVSGDRGGRLIVRERKTVDPDASFSLVAWTEIPQKYNRRSPVCAVVWSPCGSLIAAIEENSVRLRRAGDLSEAGPFAEYIGKGPMALGGDGAWLAVLSESSVRILSFPDLERRDVAHLGRGGFEYFYVLGLAADPHGPLIAVSDDGGRDETAMGVTLDHGTPQVTLFDVERRAVTGAIEEGHYVRRLAFDPYRGRLLTAGYHEMGIWTPAGELVRRFRPYEELSVPFAVTERWLFTCPDVRMGLGAIDLWDASSFEPLATAAVPRGISPDWIVASPDGRTLLAAESIADNESGIRVRYVLD